MSNGWVLPDELLRDAPAYTPRPFELADLELLLSGAYAPLDGFMGRADLASVARRGRLANATPWPVPVTLQIPGELTKGLDLANPAERALVLTDPEGAPTALLEVTDLWPNRQGGTAWAAPSAGSVTAGTARSSGCAGRRARYANCCRRAGCSG